MRDESAFDRRKTRDLDRILLQFDEITIRFDADPCAGDVEVICAERPIPEGEFEAKVPDRSGDRSR